MKFTTLIPTIRNDGSPVDSRELQEILAEFWTAFGAATIEGPADGFWLDDGKLYQSLKLSVACENERLSEAEALVRDVGTATRPTRNVF